jgi:hypothetical protein
VNTAQTESAATSAIGKAERALGNAETEALRIKDQVAGALLTGYEMAADSVSAAMDEAPAAFRKASSRAQKQVRRGNAEIKRQLGDDGPLYLLAGAIGLATLGIFALRRR